MKLAQKKRKLTDRRYFFLHLLVIPGVLFYIVFRYVPMSGLVIAFKNYYGQAGGIRAIWEADWVGFQNFTMFFKSIYFKRVFGNTLIISVQRILFTFPAPILLALMINEIRSTMLSPYIIHRFRIRAVLFGSMLCFVGRSALLLASATPTQVLLTQLTQGFCLGLYYPVTIVYINETIPENERNFAQGINCAVSYGAGSMLGNFVGGRVAETYGANAMLTVSGAFCAMGVLIYMFFQLSKRAKSI